jgi:serine/threonine-protein kinase RsbW
MTAIVEKAIELHIPSVLGYEKVAMDSAAAAARIMGFHQNRIEDLRTAVSEACINAMEHGNQLATDTAVLVTLTMKSESLEVDVKDQGTGLPGEVATPDLERKLAEVEDTRGWGMFLIKNLVDEVEFKTIPEGGNVTRMVIHIETKKA